jgi:hypothetical protein
MSITITLPTVTLEWVPGDLSESPYSSESHNLVLTQPLPQSVGFLVGCHTDDSLLVAAIDKKIDTGLYWWWIYGVGDELCTDREGHCQTLAEAKSEVLKRIGGVA